MDDVVRLTVVVNSNPVTATVRYGLKGNKGDVGPVGPAAGSYISQNKDSINLGIGTAVTEDVSGSGFIRANASNNNKNCIGLLSANINQNISGPIQTGGTLMLTDWTAIIGTPALATKGKYYLDTVAGKLTTVAPSIPGQICQQVGFALDSLTLSINIRYAILL